MAAFRKGHVKVIKWMVKHVTQFPSDPECMRYIQTVTDKVGTCLSFTPQPLKAVLVSLSPMACRGWVGGYEQLPKVTGHPEP